MGRQIILQGEDDPVHLREVLADNEAQLQREMQKHPELLPIEEFGLEGPLMIIGRETMLPSGAADLVGMAPSGDIVIVEFKTGPQNSDFRHALAQLLDYGAAIWGMEPDEFESNLVRRYLQGDRCPPDAPARGAVSLAEAGQKTWPDRTEEDVELFAQRWHRCLRDGSFLYVLAAQRFTPTMERTIQHLNDQATSARFYAVEIVRFAGGGWDAFEGRSVLKPERSRRESQSSQTDENELLEGITDVSYRETIEELLAFARGQRLVLGWGSAGVSIRVRVPDANEPLTIAWLFPPDRSGWIGLRDLTLGYDRGQAQSRFGSDNPSMLARYVETIADLYGAEPVVSQHVIGHRAPPTVVTQQLGAITDAIAEVVAAISSRA